MYMCASKELGESTCSFFIGEDHSVRPTVRLSRQQISKSSWARPWPTFPLIIPPPPIKITSSAWPAGIAMFSAKLEPAKKQYTFSWLFSLTQRLPAAVIHSPLDAMFQHIHSSGRREHPPWCSMKTEQDRACPTSLWNPSFKTSGKDTVDLKKDRQKRNTEDNTRKKNSTRPPFASTASILVFWRCHL